MISIRLATVDDCEPLASVHVTASQESYRELLPESTFDRVPERAEKWRQILAQEPAIATYVAEQHGRVIGFASGGPSRDDLGMEMELHAIYLLAGAKRQGIGGRLLRTVMVGFLSHGALSASVWTLRDNWPTRRFYEKFGAQFVTEKLEHRPGYDLTTVAYIWPDLRRSFSN